jgi:acyl-coenzyme A thioesterase PaaI-like protein
MRSGDLPRAFGPPPAEPAAIAAFGDLIEDLRRFQDAVAGTNPPLAEINTARTAIQAATKALAPYVVPEAEQLFGKVYDRPGRGHGLLPPVTYDVRDEDSVRGRVTFTRFYLGGGAAAHGGSLPLVFDEMFGLLSGAASSRGLTRTAFLHLNYRAITPLDRELTITGQVQSVDGRKIVIAGELRDGDLLLCDAEGLFVTLKPGQP